ncbi:hypothetical protein [Chryseobacterium sp. IT-36CA2]|uniref:hypothetical protein n=1 Tax=Chryseobacterium sp. IT-36CA2 TaxID=3026460 RepID=UPI0039E17D32
MKKITLLLSLLLISSLIIYGCSSEIDSVDRKESNTPIISAININKKFMVQVKKGTEIKIYDTLKVGDIYTYNDKGILFIGNKISIKNPKSKLSPGGWYIDCERYIGSYLEIWSCDRSDLSIYDPRFVGSDFIEENILNDDLYFWIPADPQAGLYKGPMVYHTNSVASQEYLKCWSENSPTSVVEPYTGQNVNKKK